MSISVEVDVALEDVLDELDDKTLLNEVKNRDLSKKFLNEAPATMKTRELVEAFERAWERNDRSEFSYLLTKLTDLVEFG